jgi:hypothetical protein
MQVIGLVEDDQCFFTFTFVKTKLKNRLTKHNETFGASHLNVQSKVFHHVKLSFLSSNSKLEESITRYGVKA